MKPRTRRALWIAAGVAGTGNPDVADVFTAIGDEWFNTFVLPWTDAANLDAMDAGLAERRRQLDELLARGSDARQDEEPRFRLPQNAVLNIALIDPANIVGRCRENFTQRRQERSCRCRILRVDQNITLHS